MKTLEDYLKLMKTDDVVKATQEARTKNAALLNDQGICVKEHKLPDFNKMTLEEIAEFWETHDSAEYWDEMEEVMALNAEEEPVLAELWDNEKDAAYDKL